LLHCTNNNENLLFRLGFWNRLPIWHLARVIAMALATLLMGAGAARPGWFAVCSGHDRRSAVADVEASRRAKKV
jgi:hypothetical protein